AGQTSNPGLPTHHQPRPTQNQDHQLSGSTDRGLVHLEDRTRSIIYDIESGKAGRVAALDGGGFRLMGDERLYYVETKAGYQLVDLAAIEASDQPG
ncbi:hypothetical protein, partial [Actinopolymorpha pittospori]